MPGTVDPKTGWSCQMTDPDPNVPLQCSCKQDHCGSGAMSGTRFDPQRSVNVAKMCGYTPSVEPCYIDQPSGWACNKYSSKPVDCYCRGLGSRAPYSACTAVSTFLPIAQPQQFHSVADKQFCDVFPTACYS